MQKKQTKKTGNFRFTLPYVFFTRILPCILPYFNFARIKEKGISKYIC